MEKIDILIIGAGVIGLAIGERLASRKKEVVVVEKYDGFGRETSSHNSEVIHAGFYYPQNSLKAGLCVTGNRMLYSLCRQKNIPHNKIGKIVVAQNEKEIEKINHLFEQGKINGVTGLELFSREQIQAVEPYVSANVGLYSPETGIIDSHHLMKFFEQAIQRHQGIVAYNCEVVGIAYSDHEYEVAIRDADNSPTSLKSPIVINAAGLSSDAVAGMAGIDIDAANYRLHPCKGEYFRIAEKHREKLKHLVYPAPTAISLGTHVVIGLDGNLKIGPNAFYVDKIDYDVDSNHRNDFFNGVKQYLPFIASDDLSPDMAGIRPKLQKHDETFRDFVICEESNKGLPGFIDLIGIESPGLTACLSIAEYVEKLIEKM